MLSVTINGKQYQGKQGQTILQICQDNHIFVPTLCYHPDLPPSGKCGLCVVKIDGNTFVYACMQPGRAGMHIETKTEELITRQQKSMSQFVNLMQPPNSTEIEDICRYLNPKTPVRYREADRTYSITFNPSKCINCGKCNRTCSDLMNIGALNDLNPRLRNNGCISCGQCIQFCPTEALYETSSVAQVMKAIVQRKVVIMQVAPAVRVTIGELFGDTVGTVCTGKIITAARQMGFQYILDTCFGADVTIMEQATELIERLERGLILPLFTSCCPAWVNYIEKTHTELIPNLSTTRSPHMIVGKLVKSYFADKMKIKADQIYMVSLMPCVAKKDEIKRMQVIGDVDAVLTTREFNIMCENFGIEWSTLKDGEFDSILGSSSGGGNLFGVTGGVAESAVRYAYELLNKKKLEKSEVVFDQFRGYNKSIKKADFTLGKHKISVAVCNGMKAAIDFIESKNYQNFQFIEVMACPGGCIAGGGQPRLKTLSLSAERAKAIYSIDEKKTEKIASENSEVATLYKFFLGGSPGSQKAQTYLHTHFEPYETAILINLKKQQNQPYIGFGSTSGTAMRYSRLVGGFMKAVSCQMNSISIEQLRQRQIAIFIISTTGDGEFPTNCKRFIKELRESNDDLASLRYAVLGLGSTRFPKFCVAGKQLDILLEQHHAQSILKFCPVDTSQNGNGIIEFESWAVKLCEALKLPPPKIGVHLLYSLIPDQDDSIIDNPLRPLTFEKMTLKSREVLTEKDYELEYIKYTIKLPSGMAYMPGGHVMIFPSNPIEVAHECLEAMKLNPKQVYAVKSDIANINYIPEKVTSEQLFVQYLDLMGKPNKALLRCFLRVANEEGTMKIHSLIDSGNMIDKVDIDQKQKELDDYFNEHDTACIIKEFSKYGIPNIDSLVSSCPLVVPRTYSISSAQVKNRGFLSIIVSTEKYSNGKRLGLCSKFLKSEETKRIPLRIVENVNGFVEVREDPVIYIATGRGIASVIGAFEQREFNLEGNENNDIGNSILFYGCRHKGGYGPLIKTLEEFKTKGVVDDIFYAFSRDSPQDQKKHIQDVMKQKMAELWALWQNPACILMYAGLESPGNISEDIVDIMLQVTQVEGELSVEDAIEFNSNHKFIFDLYD